jgi:hypothetical protein
VRISGARGLGSGARLVEQALAFAGRATKKLAQANAAAHTNAQSPLARCQRRAFQSLRLDRVTPLQYAFLS